LKSLNLTVYALNAILDAPQCQKFRPQVTHSLPELEKLVPELHKEPESARVDTRQQDIPDKKPPVLETTNGDDIDNTIANLPFETKKLISAILAKFLVAHGRENIGDTGLNEFIRRVLTPVIQYQSAHNGGKPTSSKNQQNDLIKNIGMKLEFKTEQAPTPVYASSNISNEVGGHSTSSRLFSVASSRVVGSALPAFTSMNARYVF